MKIALLLLSFAALARAQYAGSASGSTTAAAEVNSKPAVQVSASNASGNCTAGKDLWTNTTNGNFYVCTATNTWTLKGTVTGIFDKVTATAPAFSATPTFSLADVSAKSPVRIEPGAMTANVTSVTFTNKTAGAKFSIAWLQDGTGGRTVTYGASASNTCVVDPTLSITTTQFLEVGSDGTTVNGTGCTTNNGGVETGPESAAPGTPASATWSRWGDSTNHIFSYKANNSATVSNTVIPDTGAANNFLTAISAGGVISKAQPSFTNLTGSVAAAQMPALTGDATSSAGTVATTLATVNSNTGVCGDSTHVCQVTLDGKGRATAATATLISGAGSPPAGTPLAVQTSDITVTNTTAETAISGSGVGSNITPANYFAVGTSIVVWSSGYFSSAITDTLNIKIKSGNTGTVIVGQTGAFTPGVQTNSVYRLHAVITCRTTGATGAFTVNTILETTGSALAPNEAKILNTSTVALDTTVTLSWAVTATWGTAAVADTLTSTNFMMFSPGGTLLTGDVTDTAAGVTTLTNIPTNIPMAGSLLATAIIAPGTPIAGKGSIYEDSTSKNMALKNDAGTVNHGIQTRTATANNWIRSIADDGSSTISQPAFSDISGTVPIASGGTNTASTLTGIVRGGASYTAAELSGDCVTSGSNATVCGSLNTVSFSATPVFNLSLGIVQTITLTGNVTSSTFSNGVAGKRYSFILCQDGTGSRTFAWGAAWHGTMTIGATASLCSTQEFAALNATTLYAVAPGVINQ